MPNKISAKQLNSQKETEVKASTWSEVSWDDNDHDNMGQVVNFNAFQDEEK